MKKVIFILASAVLAVILFTGCSGSELDNYEAIEGEQFFNRLGEIGYDIDSYGTQVEFYDQTMYVYENGDTFFIYYTHDDNELISAIYDGFVDSAIEHCSTHATLSAGTSAYWKGTGDYAVEVIRVDKAILVGQGKPEDKEKIYITCETVLKKNYAEIVKPQFSDTSKSEPEDSSEPETSEPEPGEIEDTSYTYDTIYLEVSDMKLSHDIRYFDVTVKHGNAFSLVITCNEDQTGSVLIVPIKCRDWEAIKQIHAEIDPDDTWGIDSFYLGSEGWCNPYPSLEFLNRDDFDFTSLWIQYKTQYYMILGYTEEEATAAVQEYLESGSSPDEINIIMGTSEVTTDYGYISVSQDLYANDKYLLVSESIYPAYDGSINAVSTSISVSDDFTLEELTLILNKITDGYSSNFTISKGISNGLYNLESRDGMRSLFLGEIGNISYADLVDMANFVLAI